jgi:hypothetical protein
MAEKQIKLLRRASPRRRSAMALRMTTTAIKVSRRAIQRLHADWSELESTCSGPKSTMARNWQTKCVRTWRRGATMSEPDYRAAIALLVEVFQTLGVAYHIGGSVANMSYGITRTTLDVDLVADLRVEHIQLLVSSRR